jgi:hypothetical protein
MFQAQQLQEATDYQYHCGHCLLGAVSPQRFAKQDLGGEQCGSMKL